MGKYDLLIKKLNQSVSSVSSVEQVIIDLLKADKLTSAISIAKDIHPSRAFASAFASGIRRLDDYFVENFIEMKAIAEEDITEEEADAIIREYTGPNGKKCACLRSVPKQILRASSKGVMIRFFKSVLEDKAVGSIEYAKEYWPFLEQKI